MATTQSNKDRLGDLIGKVNGLRIAAGVPALVINKNLMRAAQYRCNRLQSGESTALGMQADVRTPLQLARAAWYSGDRVEALEGEGESDLLSYLPQFEKDDLAWIRDSGLNEIGAGFGGGPYGLFCVVLLGHRTSFPDAETTGAELPIALAEGLSFYDQSQWLDSKFQW